MGTSTDGHAPTPESGLTSAQAYARLRIFGENRLVRPERFGRAREILKIVADPMAIMLAASAAVYFLLGENRDALILLAALVPVLGVDVLLEARSRAALKSLASQVAPRAKVIRDGRETEIRTEEVVPGDILLLVEGDVVHADGMVRAAANLAIDESSLTGESEPQNKQVFRGDDAPEDSRFWAGSIVVAGHGRGEVTTTGGYTRFGETANLVAEVQETSTPLQRRVAALFKSLALGAAGVATLVGGLSLARGDGWGRAILTAVSLSMAAMPEEFPLVLTVFLSLGAWRLSKRGVLVRRLSSVETLGSTTVICLDKTGTLTYGKFGLGVHIPLRQGVSDDELLEAAALASEVTAVDPLDRAIVVHCAEHGVDRARLHRSWRLAVDYDFDPHGKHMSHVWTRRDETGSRIVAKGALEGILEHCNATHEEQLVAAETNRRLGGQGFRVLAVAGRDDKETPLGLGRESDESGLQLLGLLGFRDPIRPEVPAAVAACQDAGIAIKMITGDHAFTAHAIAEAAGIRNAEREVTGVELSTLDQANRAERIRNAAIFARVHPAQKHAIVVALQEAGETVAMTGDGINDAPALRRADIGVSMGERAVQVARAAADIVLLKDNLSALVDTVAEGRRIYDNIRRAFLYLLAFHVPIIVLALAVPLAGLPLLLQPVHLVWLELIVHPVSALVFEAEPANPSQMKRPPRRRDEPLVALRLAIPALLSGLVLAVGAFAVYALELDTEGESAARGAALSAIVLGSIFLVWTERSAADRPGTLPLPRSARFWIVMLTVLASVPLCLYVKPLATMLHLAPPSLLGLALAVLASVAAVAWRPIYHYRQGGNR
jgi:Ca2+-transporting ATPase